MPELLLIPFLFFLRKKITTIQFKSRHIFFTVLIILVLFCIGSIYDEFPIYGMLSSSRSWFYLFVCMFAFSTPNQITNNDLMWLSFGSITAWLVDSLMNYQKAIAAAATGEQYVTYGVLLAVPILCSSSIKKSKYLLLLIGVAIISVTVVFAGVRRLLVVLLLSLLVGLLYSLLKKKKNIVPYTVFSLIFGAMVMAALPVIRDYVYETSPEMYYRVFVRTENFLETGDSGSAGDQSRQKHLNDFFDNFEQYTLPRGMVSMKTKQGQTAGEFNDYPIYQLSWIFGWPIAFCLLFIIGLVLVRNMRKYNKTTDETSFVSINSITVMFMLLFLEGTYIEYPYATPITGLLLGRAWLNSKTRSLIQ
ncbi:hypothetical protein L6466_13400 [Prevotella communis]|uniref:hypothetical protein n=1 Tax=Prevotella communis TaxID=2913614 RepID=UPI001EDB0C1D|nr:hypothetical protein [Prevotella communis]UKK67566.1 hypothetical protein L6464_13270 [Prevotella communis]UKK70288.1 hypothetical protein L6466_13400 [Prevotella communis]